MTIESGIFTSLFPCGVGYFTGRSMAEYMRVRMKCFGSVWTLFKPYLLIMFQVRQSVTVAKQCSPMMLEAAAVKFLKHNPTATEQVRACVGVLGAQTRMTLLKAHALAKPTGTPASFLNSCHSPLDFTCLEMCTREAVVRRPALKVATLHTWECI